MSRQEVEAKAGFTFVPGQWKQGVHVFLCRYTGRDMKKGEDYQYLCEAKDGGFVAHLHAPVWSHTKRYTGEVRATEKQAESSAAEQFASDEIVLDTAQKLPPPMSVCIAHANAEFKKDQKANYSAIKQVAAEQYNQYRDSGYSMALWDGTA